MLCNVTGNAVSYQAKYSKTSEAASFWEGREQRWPEMLSGMRTERCLLMEGFPGTELVRGWWHKDVVGFGEEPHLKQNQTLVIWDVFEGWWEHLGSSTSRDSTGKMPPISAKCSQ